MRALLGIIASPQVEALQEANGIQRSEASARASIPIFLISSVLLTSALEDIINHLKGPAAIPQARARPAPPSPNPLISADRHAAPGTRPPASARTRGWAGGRLAPQVNSNL
jgi:hypothetical protein